MEAAWSALHAAGAVGERDLFLSFYYKYPD